MKNYCCFYTATLLSTQPRQVVVARTAPKSSCFNLLGCPRKANFSHHQVKMSDFCFKLALHLTCLGNQSAATSTAKVLSGTWTQHLRAWGQARRMLASLRHCCLLWAPTSFFSCKPGPTCIFWDSLQNSAKQP